MILIFHPEAEAEMLASGIFYESQRIGLGDQFLEEVERSLQNIATAPLRWPVLTGQVRRYLLQGFPFGILYRIEANHIYILAVMHLHREPNYWKHRITS